MLWRARWTYQEVMQMASISFKLVTTIRQRQMRYLGNVLRGSNLEKDCRLGTIEGRAAKERQGRKFMEVFKILLGCSGF